MYVNMDKHSQQLLALESLFKRYYKPLKAYAFRYVNQKEMAEDIVQDVFFELWSRRDAIRFEEAESVKSYLFKSVYNRSLNMLNSDSLHLSSPLDGLNENLIIETAPLLNQEQSLLMKELEAEIAAFTETLPPQCKNIFILSRTHELKNREIAEQLGISVKAVEKQISKALSELKKHLMKKDLLFIMFLFHRLL
jgi:RNA polymerase sigma-70 factor (ECF subfamily)